MALQNNIELESGIVVEDAYTRVESVKLQNKTSMSFEAANYVNDSKLTAFRSTGYLTTYDLAGDNPIKQAYLHLKTLPEFAEAQDV
jgi:hypothetical protein